MTARAALPAAAALCVLTACGAGKPADRTAAKKEAAGEKPAYPAGVEGWIAALEDVDPDVRKEAAGSLGRSGDPRAVEPLIGALKDPDHEVVESAADALVALGDPAAEALMDLLEHDDTYLSLWAVEILKKMNDVRAVEPLLAALKKKPSLVTVEAADALAGIGPAAIPALIETLGDESEQVRGWAALALGKIADREAASALAGILGDEALSVRQIAVWALGEIADPETVEPLAAALQDETSGIQKEAADALVKIGQPALDALISALGSADAFARENAARALGGLKEPAAVKPLAKLLARGEAGASEAAATALAEIGEAAVPALIKALSSKKPAVAKSAAAALEKATGQSLGKKPAAWKAWWAGQAGGM
jgi:HEAT repeat protein